MTISKVKFTFLPITDKFIPTNFAKNNKTQVRMIYVSSIKSFNKFTLRSYSHPNIKLIFLLKHQKFSFVLTSSLLLWKSPTHLYNFLVSCNHHQIRNIIIQSSLWFNRECGVHGTRFWYYSWYLIVILASQVISCSLICYSDHFFGI